ncbi:MAG TPA: enoyl-CoA hydratase/isomerase family protein [Caulobacteraceae bacterium]|jgi:enoyl-CoA hydratase|nr:enoyl-CoA hydratase/isomerase family protein [Caulobacteraceae bacterium]
MSGPIGLTIERGIGVVRFDNPPRGYLDAAQTEALARAVETLATDPAVRTVVFTGAVPGVFIRHYDVSEIIAAADHARATGLDEAALMAAAAGGNPVTRTFEAIDALAKPTIAAINGYCQGGGFELALCCDLRITEPGEFRIGLPETNVGIFPGAGGTERLPRLIGEARALELILRGRTVGPDEALALGLVHAVASEGALARAMTIAAELAAKPAGGLAEAKALIKNRADLDLAAAAAFARGRFISLIVSDPEAAGAMRAFLATGEDINAAPPVP